jgi:hypothetical protein
MMNIAITNKLPKPVGKTAKGLQLITEVADLGWPCRLLGYTYTSHSFATPFPSPSLPCCSSKQPPKNRSSSATASNLTTLDTY